MPKVTGTYEFAPALDAHGGRVRRDGTTTDWWLIIRCHCDIGAYQRKLHQLSASHVAPLSQPLWGAHVSIVQNERPPNIELWRSCEGAQVCFEYEQSPSDIEGYVFLPVHCPEALDYREVLGLKREPKWPLHLTIGNHKNAGAASGS